MNAMSNMMNPPNLRYKDRVSDSIGRDDSDTIRHELEAHFISDNSEPLHSDLYEQIDQLEAIDVDELVKLLADGIQETVTKPVSLTDFFVQM